MVSTDLDGTLLDHHSYSWQAAAKALKSLKKNHIPVVINTSKTAEEVVRLQQDMAIVDPFIVENGSAVYIHKNDPRFDQTDLLETSISGVECYQSTLGKPRKEIIGALEQLREDHDWSFLGFNDMKSEQLAEHTGLQLENAIAANNRHFSEPLLWQDSNENLATFERYLATADLTLLKGGRFYHVLGKTNKGMAIQWLQDRQHEKLTPALIALGDSGNDLDMLKIADYPVLVKSPAHAFPDFDHKNLIRTRAIGPAGWNEAITQITSTNFKS